MAVQQKQKSTAITRSEVRWKTVVIALLAVFCVAVVFPSQINNGISSINSKLNLGLPLLPDKGYNLGLDLQGGTSLIYKADTSQVPAGDQASAVEGVRDVIERRVRGGLGVTEPVVQTTQVGSEYHIIVELPGITSSTQAIQLIGATPVLQFKEQNNQPARDLTPAEQKELSDYNAQATQKANTALQAVLHGMPFADAAQKYSEDDRTKNNGGDLGYIDASSYPELYNWAKDHHDGDLSTTPVTSSDGLNIVKRLAEKDGDMEVDSAHILICYQGAQNCTNNQYTKDQALAKINELKQQVTPQNFADMAKKNSMDQGSAANGGDIGFFKQDQLVAAYADAIWPAAVGTIVGPVETPFGYHLILKKAQQPEKLYHVTRIFIKTKSKADILPPQDAWKDTGLSGKQLSKAEVVEDQTTGQVEVSLQFNGDGTKLFSDITTRNVNKPVGIFLDGQLLSSPVVSEPITTGQAVIRGNFSLQDAQLLAQRLNSGALPVPVEILSQEKVDATLGADSLVKSFEAGVAGLILVMLFMIAYYRLPGFLSVISLLMYAVVNAALFKLLGVTMTLSGIAGFILSIGMAVDTNVLVFERLKEELRAGRTLTSAMEESFVRAWPSIRDSHVTTLISCVILIWLGTGFIKGFAVVLAVGVLMSLFTAITVTRTIMRLVFPWFKKGANKLFLGYKPSKQ